MYSNCTNLVRDGQGPSVDRDLHDTAQVYIKKASRCRAVPNADFHARHTQTPSSHTRAMPPRIPLAHVARCCRTSLERATASPPRSAASAPLASLLAGLSLQPAPPALSQTRHAHILSNLRDNKGAYSKRIRKGRGASSGYGKTSGRGTKGQGQHGKVKPWFQGGQTPLIIKHGRMGFTNRYVLPLLSPKLPCSEDAIYTRLWANSTRLSPS